MAWHDADNYLLVEREGLDDSWAIRITKGAYTGVEYSYGEVSVAEVDESEGGNAKLSFEFNIHEFPEAFTRESLEGSKEFGVYIGDILTDVIMGAVEEKENASKSGNNNTSESSDQRAVRSSGYTVSEG